MSAQKTLHDVKPQAPAPSTPEAGTATKGGGWRAMAGMTFEDQLKTIEPAARPAAGAGKGGPALRNTQELEPAGKNRPLEENKKPSSGGGGGGKNSKLVGGTLHQYGMAKGDGQATVVSAVASYNEARDSASMSDRYLDIVSNAPTIDDDTAWAMAAVSDANAGGDFGKMANPNAKPAAIGNRKVAWVIGNSAYQRWSKLSGAKADAAGMASHYRGKGFEVMESVDLTGSGMNDGASIAAANLKRGDEFVLYYAGHGAKPGIVGVDAPLDSMPVNHILSYSRLADMAAAAVGKGYGAKIILDACHTGGLQEAIAKNHATSHTEKPIETDSETIAKTQTKYKPDQYKAAVENGEAQRKGMYEDLFKP